MSSKIQTYHQERFAYIYLRQSTMAQVKNHQESTERQYALKDKALTLGWSPHLIKILDKDLGISGSQMSTREDFKTLIADISLNKVGGVFALEASRLSRSCADWHRLLELCSLTGTLILDEDGCYDPRDFNDKLILGLKATMSQAESHFIRARLDGGKRNKAKKGELHASLPVGLIYDQEGKTTLDTDEQVRSTIALVFKIFRECGSAFGVMRYFVNNNLQFPKRIYGKIWNGKLVWTPLRQHRVCSILRNPFYAGAYVFGRYKTNKKLSANGNLKSYTKCLPMDLWEVLIHQHHEGYISWQEYIENQHILENNSTSKGEKALMSRAAREGLALLQGLLICRKCGHRITVGYNKAVNGSGKPYYVCNWERKEGGSNNCTWLEGPSLDEAVSQRVLEVMKPAQLEIALNAWEELERRETFLNQQWMIKLERAQYEAQLAQRGYEEVDPSNRLVAATLEKRWNSALENLEQLRKEYDAVQRKSSLTLAAEQKQQILSLAQDLPRLWEAPTTSSKDRKRILRLLIKDITVERRNEEKKVILYIRWQGGETEEIEVPIRPKSYDLYKTSQATIDIIRSLAMEHTDDQIAVLLNEQGAKSGTKKAFTMSRVKGIRHTYSIPSFRTVRNDNEMSVREVVEKFDVNQHVVYYWIKCNLLKKRQAKKGCPLWVIIDSETEDKLNEWIQNSKRILKMTEGVAI